MKHDACKQELARVFKVRNLYKHRGCYRFHFNCSLPPVSVKLQMRPMAALQDVYGAESQKWFVYWRLFYLACSELFNYSNGEEWGVAHYTFRKPAEA